MAEEVKRGRGRPRGTTKKLQSKREMTRFVQSEIHQDKNGLISLEDNARYTKNALEVASLPIVNLLEADQVKERIQQYFGICEKNGLKPNLAGLSLSMHMDRRELIKVCNGQKKAPQEVVDLLTQARRILNDLMESYQYDGKIQPVAGIFLSKNNFAYTDQTDVVVSNADRFDGVQNATEIRSKYLEDMVDDDSVSV